MQIQFLGFNIVTDNNHMVGHTHANNEHVDDELVGLVLHLVLVTYAGYNLHSFTFELVRRHARIISEVCCRKEDGIGKSGDSFPV